MENTTTISYKRVTRFCKKLEKTRLDEGQKTMCWVSMLRFAPITTVHHDSDAVEIHNGWKELIEKRLNEYNANI